MEHEIITTSHLLLHAFIAFAAGAVGGALVLVIYAIWDTTRGLGGKDSDF